MPKTPIFGELPKEHPIHDVEQERSERTLHRVEDENREFNEISREMAADISILQLGIHEKLARTIAQGVNKVAGETATLTRLKEEKVQSGLYRAVQGNEVYETEFGEDSKNYMGSANVRHMESGMPRRMVNQMSRVGHGIVAIVGGNNFVEAEVDKRFGENRNVVNRHAFVAGKLRPVLERLAVTSPTELRELYKEIGVPTIPPSLKSRIGIFINMVAGAGLLKLRTLRGLSGNLFDSDAFKDLMLLAKVDQESTTESGLEAVYDHEKLREEWEGWRGKTPDLTNAITNMLVPNSLFPLEDNNEGKALLGELRVRLAMEKATGTTGNVLKELEKINSDERPMELELKARIDNCRSGMLPLLKEGIDLVVAATDLDLKINAPVTSKTPGLNAQVKVAGDEVVAEKAKIVAPATSTPELAALEAKLVKVTADRDAANAELGKTYASLKVNAKKSLEVMAAAKAVDLLETIDFSGLGKMNVFAAILKAPDLTAHLGAIIKGFAEINTKILPKLDTLLTTHGTFTPFVLLQRLLRRDYMKSAGIDPSETNEEANHYATLKAGLRVEDIVSIDRKRSANDQAAEFLDRGILARGGNKLRLAVAKGQDFVGLEPFNIQYQTADRILEQIIGSRPEFAVFKGVNKFTTTRDLRQVLNKTGAEVSPETLARFAETVEEAISKYKHVPPSLEKGLNPEDWDLEGTVSILKKLRIEMWSRKQLAEVRKAGTGSSELALVALLKGAREIDQNISKSIRDEVKHPDAVWRKFLAKDALKSMLNEKELAAWKKIREAGIENLKNERTKKNTEMTGLAADDVKRQKLVREIENLDAEIKVIDDQIKESTDLYDKVEKARVYIRENKLSRKEKKLYLKELGLTQIFDKMSTNFRLQRAWHYTKKGGAAAWKWSREKFLNMDSVKSGLKKTFSVGRVAATPVTWGIGMAWKVGTFPARMAYRALRRSTHMPKRFAGIFSKSMMRSYLRDRIGDLDQRMADIAEKQAKLAAKIPEATYSWDKKRLMKKINALEDQKVDLMADSAEYKKIAAEKQLNLGSFAIYGAPANDNAAAKPKVDETITKKAA